MQWVNAYAIPNQEAVIMVTKWWTTCFTVL